MNKKEFVELQDELESLEQTRDNLNLLMKHKDKLSSIPENNLNNNQRIWLLAFEASESRMIKMAENKNETTVNDFVESMFILKAAI